MTPPRIEFLTRRSVADSSRCVLPRSIKLLISVRDADEARDALAGGADVIDVKEPDRGSLGAASAPSVRSVLELVDGRVPVSAALGELFDEVVAEKSPERACERGGSRPSRARIGDGAAAGCDFAKLGLAGCRRLGTDWSRHWMHVIRQFPEGTRPVAVAYADHETCDAPAPLEVIDAARRIGCAGFLIDTFDKSLGPLPGIVSDADVSGWLKAAREAGMFTVLAGSLRSEHLATATAWAPDLIAVRGAACAGDDRTSRVDRSRVAELARCLAVRLDPVEHGG